jgi:hypothetical protein
LPHRYHGSGDSVPAELLPIAILHGHGFDLKEFVKADQDLPYYLHDSRGRIISSYPVLTGLLNLPVYAVASLFHSDLMQRRSRLSLYTGATLTSFSVLFVFLTLRTVTGDRRHSLWFALLYAFGTNAWSNGAIALFQHGTSLFFLTGAIYCLSNGRTRVVPWAGLLLGLAVCARPTNILFALPLAVYVFFHRRSSSLLFAGMAAIPAALLGTYSEIYWGSLRALGQGQGGWGFDGHVLSGLAGLLFSPSRGLLVLSPIFIFGLFEGIRQLIRRTEDPLLSYLFVSAVLLVALYTRWGNWWGGHSFSYRILTEVSPALILLTAAAWRTAIRNHVAWRSAFYFLAGIAIIVQILGVWPYPTSFNDDIDTEPARLWNWKESELTLGASKLLARYHFRRHELHVHHIGTHSRDLQRQQHFHVWWNWANNDENIPGWYDSPTLDGIVHGTLVVDGWAKSATGNVDVCVILDEGVRVALPHRYPRPDVAMVRPHLGDQSTSGWSVSFPYDSASPTIHTVTVEFRAPNGHVRFLPPLYFRWEPQ